jgi:acyl-[acyl carrier protein]--UDP-N-acetylglucosamine O-acyltransferase
MNSDTRGLKRNLRDNGKRHNLREVHERQYRKDQRFEQGLFEPDRIIEIDDSTKFLKKMQDFDEKKQRAFEKNKIYEQEMLKCMPKARGKAK